MLNYGTEGIDTIRETCARTSVSSSMTRWISSLVKPELDHGRNLAGGNRRKSVPPQVCRC
jgi:hypothetical protein